MLHICILENSEGNASQGAHRKVNEEVVLHQNTSPHRLLLKMCRFWSKLDQNANSKGSNV